MEQMVTTLPRSQEDGLNSRVALRITPDIISTDIVDEPSRLYHISKRCIDIVLATIGIVVLTPVFLIIAIRIKCDDGGPVFHFREIVAYMVNVSSPSSFGR